MSQKLKMPFKAQMMLCGYKNGEYEKNWGYPHYGIDVSAYEAKADNHVLASGDGVVVAAARDNSLGYGVAILYKDCVSRDGKKADLVARYMHLSAAKVAKHDVVKAGDVIGLEGKEGTGGYHLHLELDTDAVYPTYSPQVSNGHTFWMKGIDSTVNPSMWLFVGDGQKIVKPAYNTAWLNPEDMNIPEIKEENEMADTVKLPINEEIPLTVEKVVDGELEAFDAHGEPMWAWVKKDKWLYIFDKYWRKIPTSSSNYAAEFASEEARKNAHPVTAAEKATIAEGVTDPNEYDEDGNAITPDEPHEPEKPEEPEKPSEPVKPEKPVTPPSGSFVCPFAGNTAQIKELAKQILELCGG